MKRFVCVHGHFYQPPRENPWLDAVGREDSAAPYHDWNERITAECYGPNAHARILDSEGKIAKIVNNYARMSFNFGPTLLSWLESRAPATYAAVLAADRESLERFDGHGSAFAQAYNHMIMPLADARDKRTQILWGAKDFARRFGRPAEGMWLPEAAADTKTLEALAEAGIRFTLLAPGQAKRFRPVGERAWTDASPRTLDTTRSYWARLSSGRRLAVYFYEGTISQALAFEGLLARGEHLAGRLKALLPADAPDGALAHVATDGETYGHHHRFGEMALAWALDRMETGPDVELTNYGRHLELHPPVWEAEVVEGSSWSCAHGVERWRSDCGCETGGRPGWTQGWRAPLREALDFLRDSLRPVFEAKGSLILRDPWAARDCYIDVILDRSPESISRFLAAHASGTLAPADEVQALRLLELQRHAMLMYTSCGWFFNDLAGLETVQILRYAARALELCRESGGPDLESAFVDRLAMARSNDPAEGDGRRLWERRVLSGKADPLTAAERHGTAALLEERPRQARIDGWEVTQEDGRRLKQGGARLTVGRLSVVSSLTRSATQACYCFLQEEAHLPEGAVCMFAGMKAYEAMLWETTNLFSNGDLAGTRASLEKHFPESPTSRRGLSSDEERRVAERLLEGASKEAEDVFVKLYERDARLLRALARRGVPAPRPLKVAAELALNAGVKRLLEASPPDLAAIEAVLDELKAEAVPLDEAGLAYTLGHLLRRLAEMMAGTPDDIRAAEALDEAAALAHRRAPWADLWSTQNIVYKVAVELLPERRRRAAAGDKAAKGWCAAFARAAAHLNVKV